MDIAKLLIVMGDRSLSQKEILSLPSYLQDKMNAYKQELSYFEACCSEADRLQSIESDKRLQVAIVLNEIDALRLLCWKIPMFLNGVNAQQYTPLTLAIKYGYQEIIYYLLSFKEYVDVNFIYQGKTETFTALLKFSAIFNQSCKDKEFMHDETLLHYAIKKNQLNNVKLLVEAGAKLTAPTQDGYYPLNLAVMYSNVEMVSYLLNNGALIDQRSTVSDVTPLQQAPVYGKTDILKKLISSGADVNIKAGKQGYTVLDYAIQKNRLEDVKALIEAGAKLTTSNQDSYLPFIVSNHSIFGTVQNNNIANDDLSNVPVKNININ
jgi:ankyrin repeat protein